MQLIQPIGKRGMIITRATAIWSTLFLVSLVSCAVTDSNSSDEPSDLEQAAQAFEQLSQNDSNITIAFPEEDPGIPIYARVGPILNQFFVTEGKLVIPFYRDPECIRDDFNFLTYYDPPAAFGCELTVGGKFVIEQDAEQGSFPIMAHTSGTAVPIWIVDWSEFKGLIDSESITLPEIEALNPTIGVAQQYEEYLSPRLNEHQVIIEATGMIQGSEQEFEFTLTHRGDQIEKIDLKMD